MADNKRVCAVVVTYNRKDLLIECLNALLSQTRRLDSIYIIDNASTDGTHDLLRKNGYINSVLNEMNVFYARMPENTGGAGGFCEGIKKAYEKGYNWIWVMDDDVVPCKDCLEALVLAWNNISEKKIARPSALACARFYKNSLLSEDEAKKLNLVNPFKKLHQGRITYNDLKSEYISVEGVTFEGLFIPSEAITEVGFPNRDFFIYGDDTEYCLRLLRFGSIYYVPTARITKMRFPEDMTGLKYSWKKYYMLRNLIFIDLKYAKLSVKIVRIPYELIRSILGRIFYLHFSDIPTVMRILFDAWNMSKK